MVEASASVRFGCPVRLRVRPDERHPHDALILLGALEHQPVIAEMVAVVAGEDHHRVVAPAALVERTKHRADGVVDAGDHAAGQRPRLLRLARRHADGAHAGQVRLAALALLEDVLHQRRRRPVVARERLRHRELLGLVHVPVFAGRIERMMRIGKRHHQEERLVVLGLVEIGAGALAEERGGVKLLRDRGAIGLRHAVVVRQAVLRTEQILRALGSRASSQRS